MRWEAGDLGDTDGLGVAWAALGASLPGSGDNLSDLTSFVESEGILSSVRAPLGTSRRTFLRPLAPYAAAAAALAAATAACSLSLAMGVLLLLSAKSCAASLSGWLPATRTLGVRKGGHLSKDGYKNISFFLFFT